MRAPWRMETIGRAAAQSPAPASNTWLRGPTVSSPQGSSRADTAQASDETERLRARRAASAFLPADLVRMPAERGSGQQSVEISHGRRSTRTWPGVSVQIRIVPIRAAPIDRSALIRSAPVRPLTIFADCSARSRPGLIAPIYIAAPAASASHFLYAFLSASASMFRSTPSTSYRHILTAGAAAMAQENQSAGAAKGAGEGG